MEPLLPSEIARLVLGYLQQEKCESAAKSFLESSPHLTEYRSLSSTGRRYPTRVNGFTLTEILDEYCSVHEIVQEGYGKMVSTSSEQPRSMLERLKHLVKSCQPVQVNISLCTRSEQSAKSDSILGEQIADGEKQPLLPICSVQATTSKCGPQGVCYSTPLENLQTVGSFSSQTSKPETKHPPTSSIPSDVIPDLNISISEDTEERQGCVDPNRKLEEATSRSHFFQQSQQSHDSCSRSAPRSDVFRVENSEARFPNTSESNSSIDVSSNFVSNTHVETENLAINSTNYTVTESYGSNIVILNNSSQPSSSSCGLLGSLSVRDFDVSKKFISCQEKSKQLTPSKVSLDPAITEKISVAIEKNTAFTEKIAANITKVIQATPVKQCDAVSMDLNQQKQGPPEEEVNDIVHTILKETEEDPIFDSFLHEFLHLYDPTTQNSNETASDCPGTKKKKKRVQQKSVRAPADNSPSARNIIESDNKVSSAAANGADMESSRIRASGMTPAKLVSESDTLTPISKLLKSITSPSNDLYLEPTPFAGLVDVTTPAPENCKPDNPQATTEQVMQVSNKTVPLIVCTSSQQAAQYVNQQGVSTLCEFQLIPQKSNYVAIAPKFQSGPCKPIAFQTPVTSEPRPKFRKRCLTRGGRLSSGVTHLKTKGTAGNEASSSNADSPAGTVTLYAAGDSEQSSTVTVSYPQSLPIILTEDVSSKTEQNCHETLEKSTGDAQCNPNPVEPIAGSLLTSKEVNENAKPVPQKSKSDNQDLPALTVISEKQVVSVTDTSILRNTPGMQNVKLTKDKRLSMSTPRRRRSHIRALDFNTPPKDTSQSARKAHTSPKSSSMNSISPGTAAKLHKSCSRRSFLKSHSESGVRTSKVKAHLFKSPDYVLSSSSGYKAPLPASASTTSVSNVSPKPSTAWDDVTGVGLILEKPHSPPVKKVSPKVSRLKSWDADLRRLVISSDEPPKSEPVIRKRKISSPNKLTSKNQAKKRNKKSDKIAEKCKETEEVVDNEVPDTQSMNVSNSSENDMAKQIEANLMDLSAECEPSSEKESSSNEKKSKDAPVQEKSVPPSAHSSPLKSSPAVSSPKSDNMLDIEANITAYCIEKDHNAKEQSEESVSDESFASSVYSKSALSDKLKPPTCDQKGEGKLSSASQSSKAMVDNSSLKSRPIESDCGSSQRKEDEGIKASPAKKTTKTDCVEIQILKKGDASSSTAAIQPSDTRNLPITSIFDTPVKEDLSNVIPRTPRFLSPNSGNGEDTPRTKIIKAHPPPSIPSAENSIQSPTLPPTPKIPTCSSDSPNNTEYFDIDASDNATMPNSANSGIIAETVTESLESVLIKECSRLEFQTSQVFPNKEITRAETNIEAEKNDMETGNNGEKRTKPDEKAPPSSKTRRKSPVGRRSNPKGKPSPGCARASVFIRTNKVEQNVSDADHNHVKIHSNCSNVKGLSGSGDETDISLLSSPRKSSSKAASSQKTKVKTITAKKQSSRPKQCNNALRQPSRRSKTLRSIRSLKKDEIELALDHLHGKEEKSSLKSSDFTTVKSSVSDQSSKPLFAEEISSIKTSGLTSRKSSASSKSNQSLCNTRQPFNSLKNNVKDSDEVLASHLTTAPEAVELLFETARSCIESENPKQESIKEQSLKMQSTEKICPEKESVVKENLEISKDSSSSSSDDSTSSDSSSSDSSSEDEIPLETCVLVSPEPLPEEVSRNPSVQASPTTEDCGPSPHLGSSTSTQTVHSEDISGKMKDSSSRASMLSVEKDDKECAGCGVKDVLNPLKPEEVEEEKLKTALVPYYRDTAGLVKSCNIANHLYKKKSHLIKLMNVRFRSHNHFRSIIPLPAPPTSVSKYNSSTKIPDEVITLQTDIKADLPSQEISKENCSKPVVSVEKLDNELQTSHEICNDDEEFPPLLYTSDDKEDASTEDAGENFSAIEKAVAEIHAEDNISSGISIATEQDSEIRDKVITGNSSSTSSRKPEPMCKESYEETKKKSSGEIPKERNDPAKGEESAVDSKKSLKRTVSSVAADKVLKDVLEQGLGKKMKTLPKSRIQRILSGTSVPEFKPKSVVNVEYHDNNDETSKSNKHFTSSGLITGNSVRHPQQKCEMDLKSPESSKKPHKMKKFAQSKYSTKDVSNISVDQSDSAVLEGRNERHNNCEDVLEECFRTVLITTKGTLDVNYTYLGLGRKGMLKDIHAPAAIQLQLEEGSIALRPSPFLTLYEHSPTDVKADISVKRKDSSGKSRETCSTSRPGGRESPPDRRRYSRHGNGSDRDDRKATIRDRSWPRNNRSPSPRYRHSRRYSRDSYRSGDRVASGTRTYSRCVKDDSKKYDNHQSHELDRHEFKSRPSRSSLTISKTAVRDDNDAEEGEILSSDGEVEQKNAHGRKVEMKSDNCWEVENRGKINHNSSKEKDASLKPNQSKNKCGNIKQDCSPSTLRSGHGNPPQKTNTKRCSRKDTDLRTGKQQLESVQYTDMDLENDLKRFSALGDIGAEYSPSTESDSGVCKTEQPALRRAPPRSVNALKATEQTSVRPLRKRKSAVSLEPASAENIPSSKEQTELSCEVKRSRMTSRRSHKAVTAIVPCEQAEKTSEEKDDTHPADILKKLDLESFLSHIHGE